MPILCFAGSLRKDSFNKKFVREAMRLAEARGAQVEYLDLKEYPMPPYDGDDEAALGIPQNTKKLGEKIKAAEALMISAPEYNHSVSGTFKNIIDWLSREKPVSLSGKHALLIGASPGGFGAARGMPITRITFEALGVYVFPTLMPLSKADQAFDENGRLKDPKTEQQLQKLVGQFLDYVTARKA